MKKLILLALLLPLLNPVRATQWFDPLSDGVSHVCGRWWGDENSTTYNRFPERFKAGLTPSVWGLSTQSAGEYVRFCSNSRNITVRYTLTSRSLDMWHMPSTGVSGVDLYLRDTDGKERWCCSSSHSFADTVTFAFSGLEYGPEAEFTLYLPLYNGVRHMEIGVDDGSSFAFLPEPAGNPVVVYGTSIAQGACAMRPGMAWSNILQRRFQVPVINFGFSGNGLLHDAMFEAMAEIPASVYIIDCMPNMVDQSRQDSIVPRIMRGMSVLRRNSAVPVVLVEHDGYMNENTMPSRRNSVDNVNRLLHIAYDSLVKSGYWDVHYLTKEDIGMDANSQVDACHANDYGMMLYADAYGKLLRRILKLKK